MDPIKLVFVLANVINFCCHPQLLLFPKLLLKCPDMQDSGVLNPQLPLLVVFPKADPGVGSIDPNGQPILTLLVTKWKETSSYLSISHIPQNTGAEPPPWSTKTFLEIR